MSDQHTPQHDTHDQTDLHTRDVNVPVIVTVGVISVLLLVVIIIGIQAWFQYEMQQERRAKIIAAENPELQSLNNAAASKLKGGQWADADRQRVTLNIDRAMSQVSQRYRSAGEAARSAVSGGPQPGAGTPEQDAGPTGNGSAAPATEPAEQSQP